MVRTSAIPTPMCRNYMYRESLKFGKISFHSSSFILQKDGRTHRHRISSRLGLVDFLWDILTLCSRTLLEKLTVPHLVKKFSEFYGT